MASSKSPGMLMRNAGIFNPILVQAVGLCPVVAMATSVKSAALLALVSAVIVTLSEFIASLLLKPVPRWIRIGIYIILGAAIVSPFMILIERINTPLFSSLGIYLPIMAVNSLIVLRCERFAVKIPPFKALADGITASVGYAAVLLITGFLRELLGNGTIADRAVFKTPAMTGLLLPFGGFLILGFASAALRAMIAKFWPKYLDKKQPKPGSKKKHHQAPAKKLPSKPAVNIVPEFTADESPFTLEELETITNDSSDNTAAAEVVEPETVNETKAEQEPAHEAPAETEQIVQAEQPAEPEQTAEEPSDVGESSDEVETDPEAVVSDDHKQTKAAFADLTIDDIKNEDGAESSAYSNDDDLDALMNRSIDDILTKQKKEENEE